MNSAGNNVLLILQKMFALIVIFLRPRGCRGEGGQLELGVGAGRRKMLFLRPSRHSSSSPGQLLLPQPLPNSVWHRTVNILLTGVPLPCFAFILMQYLHTLSAVGSRPPPWARGSLSGPGSPRLHQLWVTLVLMESPGASWMTP